MVDPTPEQAEAIATYGDGLDMVMQAGAGCGKSSTLKMIAASDPRRRMTYVAYNRSIAADAKRSFPGNVHASTGHGLAFDPKYLPRIQRPRQTALDAARALHIERLTGGVQRVRNDQGVSHALTSKVVMRMALDVVDRYCHSADDEIGRRHIPRYDGLTAPETRDRIAELVLPVARAAWADLTRGDDGVLKLSHDVYLKCQPAGARVRVPVKTGGGYGNGGPAYGTEEVPIESLKVGDRVISWGGERLGRIRKQGAPITHVATREYDGTLITATTPSGAASAYTHDHICISMIGDSMDGKTVVYLMRRGPHYRVGRVMWRYGSQGNTLGLSTRIRSQDADAVWVLSAHDNERDAALAEALAQHYFGLPGWQFRSPNEQMPLDQFWTKVGDNTVAAETCLRAHGRDILYPLWERGSGRLATRKPLQVRACNLMDGMRVCEVDRAAPTANGQTYTGGWTEAWQPATVTREPYAGPVYSIEVAGDHTYVADGIVTHNCWALGRPRLETDVVLLDEAQDTNDVLAAVLLAQEHAQRIAVGDSAQQIYEWRGAKDALSTFERELGAEVRELSQSFRFGQPIADVANAWLYHVGTTLRLTGWPAATSEVGPVKDPDAILCRTNAGAIGTVLKALAAGRKTALVGGGGEIKRLAWAAESLQDGLPTDHPELIAFPTWQAVREYAEEEDGSLRVLVKLIDDYGTKSIISAADALASEDAAELVVSTAHKAKGREWAAVRILADFKPPKPDPETGLMVLRREEARLAYVAVTRARQHLDCEALAWVEAVTAVTG